MGKSFDFGQSPGSICAALEIPHEVDAPLGTRTWYGIGGHAQVLAQPHSPEQLSGLMRRCHEADVPVRVLGSGANLLVAGDVPGVVLELTASAFRELRIEGTHITVGAGYDLFKLVMETARRGLGGLEVLAGIPARVGGAVRMNAGGAFGEIGTHVQRVRVMGEGGEAFDMLRDDLALGYRRTNITAPVILEVEFALCEGEREALMRRVKEIFLQKKNRQPMGAKSAGCAFKNPPAEDSQGLSAGALIDRAGLKGYSRGKARVSDVHANFIVAEAGAEPTDVLAVFEHVQECVAEQFGVELEREVVVWP